ncbi:hypothetical protein [Bacillus marinisedimentorum]|uniref:hypothetical protein n=1 Tax=Bacillus marinisedimentorum TaxID=1821260 RepID=UPI000872C2A3|nr:hypothetical protein [Bacillus marinisedimentorum]
MVTQSYGRNEEQLLRLYDRVVDRIYNDLIEDAGPKEGNRIITETRSELRALAPFFPDLSLLHPWRLPLTAEAFHIALAKSMRKREYGDSEYKELIYKMHIWFIESFSPSIVSIMLKIFSSRLFQWYIRISFRRSKKMISEWAVPVKKESDIPFAFYNLLNSCPVHIPSKKSNTVQMIPYTCFLNYCNVYFSQQIYTQNKSKTAGSEKANP